MQSPFVKHAPSLAGGTIAVLALYNFLFALIIGIPLPHMVINAYVESIYELGDVQVKAYNTLGVAINSGASSFMAAILPAVEQEAPAAFVPEPILTIAPNFGP